MNSLPSDNTMRMSEAAEQHVAKALHDQVTRKGTWNVTPECGATELHPEIEFLYGLSTGVVYDRGYEIYIELHSDNEFESLLKRSGFTGSFGVVCRRRHPNDDIQYRDLNDFQRVRPSITAQLERNVHTDTEADEFCQVIAELSQSATHPGL